MEGISYRMAAVGTPRYCIGKTTSTPFLIRMLSETNCTVVYKICSINQNRRYHDFVLKFDKDGNGVRCHVSVYPEKLFLRWYSVT